MKRFAVILGSVASLLVLFGLTGSCMAQEKATKEECVAKCKEAAELIKEEGLEAALAKMNDPEGPFVWKDSYVFCFDAKDVKMLAHKVQGIVGMKVKNLKDPNGKEYMLEMIEVANTKGEGWVSYLYPKPGENTPSPKITYVLKVPGENVIVGAGIYE